MGKRLIQPASLFIYQRKANKKGCLKQARERDEEKKIEMERKKKEKECQRQRNGKKEMEPNYIPKKGKQKRLFKAGQREIWRDGDIKIATERKRKEKECQRQRNGKKRGSLIVYQRKANRKDCLKLGRGRYGEMEI